MELRDNCVLLVNSCDKYSDLWDPFFTILKREWPDFSMNIVLNTESKRYAYPGLNITTMGLYPEKKVEWGERLIETLKKIPQKYVLFTLEDYYLQGPVDVKRLETVFQYMEENPSIACFSFLPVIDSNNIQSKEYPGFELRPQKGKYRFNCQMALWRRENLLSCIRKHESPWIWEVWGSKRSSRIKEKIYTICPDSPEIFEYENGGILIRGAWNMEHLSPLLEKYELTMDLSIRPDAATLPPRKGIVWNGFLKRQVDKIKSII